MTAITCSCERMGGGLLEMVGVAELIDQSLAPLCLLHDALLVILAQRPGELVIVHGRPVLK